MGADGGTIPKRCELVKAKKKTEKVDKATKNATKWKNCQKPIIADRLGRLYNKEAIIEAILTKTIGKIEVASHIKGMKDFKELKLTDNKDYKTDEVKGDAYMDHNQSEFLCPVTSVPMNGNHNFIVNWKCGCVFSEKATQEVKSSACYGCGGPWDPADSLQLNPEDDLLEVYKSRLAAEKAEKKSKKEKNGVTAEEKSAKKAEKRKATAEETSEIQADPSTTDTYKGLFTTSKEAKAKPKNHWTTFNPLYF